MNIIYRIGYQKFYMANNIFVLLFKVYLMALSSSNYMVLNDIIIPKLERMWDEAVVTYMVNVRFLKSHSCNYEEQSFEIQHHAV